MRKFLSFITVIYFSFPLIAVPLQKNELDAIPRSYPLFTVIYPDEDLPPICQAFKPCNNYDGECKTNKGLCGETLSSFFFENINNNWQKISGNYNSTQGFDGFYKIANSGLSDVRFVVVEDKAGSLANLSQRNSQMSLSWQQNVMLHLKNSGVQNQSVYEEFNQSLVEGGVIGFFTRTLYKDNRTPRRDRNRLGQAMSGGSGDSSRYNFRTELSILGTSEWPIPFKDLYISKYKKDIHHPIFQPMINSGSRETYSFILNADSVETENFRILNNRQVQDITFR